MKKRIIFRGALISLIFAFLIASAGILKAQDGVLSPKEELGKSIFFDTDLSINNNESCATCHDPATGWTGPDSFTNAAGAVYEGSIPGRFGNRKPPSAAYATLSPIFYLSRSGLFIGGNFWDGRATGEKLGNPAADQAQGPFLNPVEQALGAPADVVERVCASAYGDLFREVWGAGVCDPANVAMAYDDIALSIAAFEDSPMVNAFTSKYDYSFKGMAKLTKQERKGFSLFMGKGKCNRCHIGHGQHALFTDYSYDNLGVPRNPENPFYEEPAWNPLGFDWVDNGLGGFLESAGYPAEVYELEMGKQKVPTLRNVDLRPSPGFVKAYSHNGYFKSLESIVHFYNTRDVLPTCPDDDHYYTEAEAIAANCWPEPEVAANMNTSELGDLGLSAEEEAAIVAFLKTLSDGYMP
jgi:cytochrome c peroxidase